jgi:hypothetical protein
MLGQKIVRPDTTPGELVLVRYKGHANVVRYMDRGDFEATGGNLLVEAEE